MKEEKIWAIKDGYLVNRDGSIYKLNWNNTGKMRKVKQTLNNGGYLCFGCNGKIVKSHRFVAECFIPNPYNLPQINHKDEDKTNNHIDNLEWCNNKYNINYGTRNERMVETLSKKVYQYTLKGEFVKEWTSVREVERVLGFSNGNISSCCNGRQKTAYKYIWKFSPQSIKL